MDGLRKRLRLRLKLLMAVGLVALCGASCPRAGSPLFIGRTPSPPVLPREPSLEQVISVVNGNSSRIRNFSTNGASLSGTGFPSLRADVVFERPRRFRLLAKTAWTGPELDLGSNDELFWFWVGRNKPPGLYCRHDQFATSPVRTMLPIDPNWLVEVLGIAELDPALPHQGPFALSDGRYSVHTVQETPAGPITKVTVVEGRRGVVIEQDIYDVQNQLVASAVTSRHRVDPLSGVTMPKIIDIHCPPVELRLRIDLGNVEVNRPTTCAGEVWDMPHYEGFPMVDLGNPRLYRPPSTQTSKQ